MLAQVWIGTASDFDRIKVEADGQKPAKTHIREIPNSTASVIRSSRSNDRQFAPFVYRGPMVLIVLARDGARQGARRRPQAAAVSVIFVDIARVKFRRTSSSIARVPLDASDDVSAASCFAVRTIFRGPTRSIVVQTDNGQLNVDGSAFFPATPSAMS